MRRLSRLLHELIVSAETPGRPDSTDVCVCSTRSVLSRAALPRGKQTDAPVDVGTISCTLRSSAHCSTLGSCQGALVTFTLCCGKLCHDTPSSTQPAPSAVPGHSLLQPASSTLRCHGTPSITQPAPSPVPGHSPLHPASSTLRCHDTPSITQPASSPVPGHSLHHPVYSNPRFP
ncbi:unnamed protein product [Gadus morhua 'NCC']